jgi:hypothetical protein
MGCSKPADDNDLRFFRDAFALIQHARRVAGVETTVPAFQFTSLLPTAPKIMLNMKVDDYGLVERRSCGCPLEACGFTEHRRDIYSYRKLRAALPVARRRRTGIHAAQPGGQPQDPDCG